MERYLQALNAPEKAKEYNRVLAITIADLQSLRVQLTQTSEDTKIAEVARANVPAAPKEDPATTNPLATLEASAPVIASTVGAI